MTLPPDDRRAIEQQLEELTLIELSQMFIVIGAMILRTTQQHDQAPLAAIKYDDETCIYAKGPLALILAERLEEVRQRLGGTRREI